MLGLMGRWAHHAIALQLAWNPSPTPNVRYYLYLGPSHGFYTNAIDCGTNLSAGIAATGVLYFAVTAYNSSGESDFSEEIAVTNVPAPLRTNLVITVAVESSPALTNVWTALSNFQFQVSNVSSNQFFRARLSAALTNQ